MTAVSSTTVDYFNQQEQQQHQQQQQSNNIEKPSTSIRECLLFPTYAYRNPEESSEWIIRTKGWALSHNRSGAKQKLMTSLTKGVVGQNNSGDQTIFEERFKYFLAKNKRNKQFIIQPIGTTSLPSDSWTSLRRDSNGSTDSGFQSATTSSSSSKDDYFFWNFNDDFNFNDNNNEMNNNNMNNNNNNNIFIMERPANPLSSVLSGRRSLQSNTSISSSLSSSSDTNQQQNNNQLYQNDEVDDGDDEDEEDEDEDEDDQLPSNEYYLTTSPSAYSSPSIITTVSKPSLLNYPSFKSIRSTTSNQSTTNTTTTLNNNNYNHGTLFKSESNGFFTGITKFSHDQVLQWAKEQDCCDSRLLKLQAIENKGDHSFPISQGIVNLIEPTGISIISDIDDTIKETQILHGARTVLQNTFFNETNDIPGMAEAYTKWYTQGASFHYVSNSPFQLLPFLQQFLNTSQFPPGSMHLRLDGSLLARLIEIPGRAKRDAILSIMNDFPRRQFVLVGDSGEIDLEIYTKIALEHPDRILKIFIHDITTKYAHYKQQKKLQATLTTSTSTTTYSSSTITNNNNNNGLSLSSLFQTSTTSKRKSSLSISTSLQQDQDNQLSNSMDDLFSITRSTTNGSSSSSSPLSSSSSSIKASSLLEMASSISSSSLLGLGRGRTKTLADLVIEPSTSTSSSTSSINNNNNDDVPPSQQCAQLYDRVKKAQDQLPSHIEIVLFQHADELRDDLTIQDALWQHWDDQC